MYTGYALCLIVNACVSSQAAKKHTDIAHVSSHFYRATSFAPFQVHIRTRRTGTFYSYLSAELIQEVRNSPFIPLRPKIGHVFPRMR